MNPTTSVPNLPPMQPAPLAQAPGSANTPVYQAPASITSSTMQPPAQPFQTQAPAPATGTDNLLGYIGALHAQNQTDAATQQQRADQYALKGNDFNQQISDLLNSPGQAQNTNTAYQQQGVDQAQSDLRGTNNQIVAEQHALNQQILQLQKNTQGLSTEQLNGEIQSAKDQSLARQANLSVVQMAQQGKYADAKAIADRAVSALTEAKQNQLNSLQFMAKQNQDLLTTAQQRAFETAQADRQNQLELAKQQYMSQFNASIQQQQMLQQQKITQQNAAYEQHLKQQDPTYGLDIQLKQAQIAQSRAATAAYSNPALLDAVQNGTIDPSKVNSRTVPFYSALANAGIDANFATINAASTKKVITNLDTQSAQITQAGKAIESNMALLANLSDKVNTLGIPAADTNLAKWEARYSDQPDVVNYLSTLALVRSEYAKYASRGGQVDDSVRGEAAQAIPVGVNGETLRSLLGVIKTEGSNVQGSIQAAKKGQWDQLQNGTHASGEVTQLAKQKNVPDTELQDAISKYGEDAVRKFLSQ